ncbi:MAG: Gfo/Idh/MocA family oxidoreductase [Verrucomicrobiales bacterium]|nr:Gfo/Idh/MocA family oxidoreductase [Verrucomicrobiales bacterium]
MKNSPESMTRRTAVKGLAIAGATGPSLFAKGANEKIIIGAIGLGGRGRGHAKMLAARSDVEVAFVCDADLNRAEQSAVEVEKAGGKRPQVVQDLRKILEDQSVDAITVATPDHWHAPATILACEAGKHVYVEKPCSHNVREGRLMVEAARKHDHVVQVGTQARNSVHVKRAMELIRDGAIGDVLVAKAWNSQKRRDIGHGKPGKPPAHLDYDLWLGPAPEVPYFENRLHYNWHWRHAFGTGDMGNDGVHELDLALWGLGIDGRHPESVSGVGNKLFFDDDQEFPDTQNVVFDYAPIEDDPQRKQLIFEMRIWAPYNIEGYDNGNAFYGTKGFILLGKNNSFRLYGGKNVLIEEMQADGANAQNTEIHHEDFLNCIRAGNGKRPQADIELGHYGASACHLGNIASRLKRTLFFDGDAEKIQGDEEANALLSRTYRDNHWASLAKS